MEIIGVDKEPFYKKVRVSELKRNDAFESGGKLHFVLSNKDHTIIIYTPGEARQEAIKYFMCADNKFPDAILCDNIKISYERVLE